MKNSYFQKHTALVWPQWNVSSFWQKERNPTDDMKWHESAHHRPNTLPQSVITIMREKKRGYERKEKTVLVNLFPRWHDHCRAATAFEPAAAEKREHITTSHQCSSAPTVEKKKKGKGKTWQCTGDSHNNKQVAACLRVLLWLQSARRHQWSLLANLVLITAVSLLWAHQRADYGALLSPIIAFPEGQWRQADTVYRVWAIAPFAVTQVYDRHRRQIVRNEWYPCCPPFLTIEMKVRQTWSPTCSGHCFSGSTSWNCHLQMRHHMHTHTHLRLPCSK